jgi:intein/homing endonuclease
LRKLGGAPTAVKSVTGDTPIIVIENGKPRYVEIGDWIDKFMETYPREIEVEDDRPDLEFLHIEDKAEVYIPTGDGKGKVSWGKLTAVTRHDPTDVVYEVETAGGRKLTVADSESLLIWNDSKQEFIKQHSSMVMEGDIVPVSMYLPKPPVVIDHVDMTEYFPKEEYVHGTEFHKCVRLMREAQGDKFRIPLGWYEDNNGKTFTLPYTSKARVQRTTVRSNTENIREGCIYPYHATREHSHLPARFELNFENGVFIGLFLADGNVHEHSGKVCITKEEVSVQEFVCNWFTKYGISHKVDIAQRERGVTTTINGNSRLFARFLDRFVGHGSRNKHIPDVAYSAPDEFVKGLLNGYISGDGSIDKHGGIVTTSVSRRLTEGIAMMCNRLGAFGKISTRQQISNNLGTVDIAPTHTLSIRAQWARILATELELVNKPKNKAMKEMKTSIEHRNFTYLNDVVNDQIVKITEVDSKTRCTKMYDVTVPSTLNFLTIPGVIQHDTSDTGYLQRRLVKAMEDAKVHYDNTVRNAANSIIQFVYGEDGIEGTKIENQILPYIDMDILAMQSTYLITEEDPLKLYLTEQAHKDHLKDRTWKDTMQSHFEALVKDRDFLIQKIFRGQQNNKIEYAIPFTRLLQNMQHRTKDMGLDTLPSNLTPLYILTQIDNLINELYVINKKQGIRFLHILLRAHLSPKPLLTKYHIQRETFDWLCNEVRRYFKEALVPPGEMVGIVAAQSLGEYATQLSVHKDSRVIVMHKDPSLCYNGTVGTFIDKLMTNNTDKVIDLGHNSTALYVPDDYYIIGVSNEEETQWRRILEVSRHPANGGLVKVYTKSGRTTTATLSHSFLKRTKEGIEPVEGGKLQLGDRIPVARYIPTMADTQPGHIKIGDTTFKLDRDFGWFVGVYLADGNATDSNIFISKTDETYENKVREICNAYNLDIRVKVTEGTINMDEKYADRVYKSKNYTIVGKGSSILAKWFKREFNTGSYKKRIPGWVFSSNKEFISGLLGGYFDGDGNINVEKQMIRVHSVNKNLIDDISVLLSYQGIFASSYVEVKKRDKASVFYVLCLAKKYAEKFSKDIGLVIPHKQQGLYEIIKYNNREDAFCYKEMIDKIPCVAVADSIAYVGETLRLPAQSRLYKQWRKHKAIGRRTLQKYINVFKVENEKQKNSEVQKHIDLLQKIADNDVVWDEIINIEYLEDPEEFVYDFTVPGNDSFMVDNGILVHNTLDSFHVSGTAAAVKATSGVPRVKELLSVSKNIKTPSLKIFLKSDIAQTIDYAEDKEGKIDDPRVKEAKERVFKVLHQLEITRLNDLLESTEIYWDPPGTGLQTSIEGDADVLAVYKEFAALEPERCRSTSPWVLRMILNKEKLKRVHLTMIDIYMKIYSTYGNTLDCVFADDNDPHLIFHVRLQEAALKDLETEDMVAALKAIEYNIANTILLKGIPKIKKVSMRQHNHIQYNAAIQKFQKVCEWIMDTDGSNFAEIMANPNIDPYRTMTNDVYEIYTTLGIEAARNALSNEIMEVMKDSSVNYRHLSMLIDTMTCKGTLMSIDRHGINRGDVGPLAKSSFEETTDMLIKASIFSEQDRINGVSANIMLGQLPPCGTGTSDILLDEEEYIHLIQDKLSYIQPRPEGPLTTFDPCTITIDMPALEKPKRQRKAKLPTIAVQ